MTQTKVGVIEVQSIRKIRIAVEAPDQPETVALLAQLDDYLLSLYRPESNHLLDVAALKVPSVRFFVARREAVAVGCGALRLDAGGYGEIKRMFVSPAARGLGLGRSCSPRSRPRRSASACTPCVSKPAFISRRRSGFTFRRVTGRRTPSATIRRAIRSAGSSPCGSFRPADLVYVADG